ncbi:hypothetical protein LTS08_002937 [Lithohypha guttulata]|uniref:uncharacterized protein n=1 Tax=Lithohypha guttulata TaxID=1690604 RepID=UPI002DE1AC48|nr:hypothetical protein LTR51_000409 [Lithohypha guttulata]KAK5103522.1 hypothetical protein LTS08_002937 [Lithohypha guttulata]
MPPDEDDPVIASYDVYISSPPLPPAIDKTNTGEPRGPDASSSVMPQKQPKYYVLQYPAHRPSSKPYNTARSQRPSSFRIKPSTGIVEVDVPILTTDNYNTPLGTSLGRAMHDSQVANPYTGHGLSGGFAQNALNAPPHGTNLDDEESHLRDTALRTQTLGGKISTSTDRDPVYMLANLNRQSNQIRLRHLDAVVQLRPQLHHIDAQEEAKRRIESASKTKAEPSRQQQQQQDPDSKVKLETKAIEMKIKDTSREDAKDRNLNLNARLLRDIQNEKWKRYEWIEKEDEVFEQSLAGNTKLFTNADGATHTQLRSALDNDEWLNRMSSPGIELRTRLKGRDRERARRKRQERLRATKAAAGSDAAVAADDSETSSSDAEGDDEMIQDSAEGPSSPEVRIKEEGAGVEGAVLSAMTAPAPAPKKRGRPPKHKQAETINLD